MAQLNATKDQIQLTTNMLKAGASTEDWTAEGSDDKYPSANAVATLVTNTTNAIIEACENASSGTEYPVESIIMTHKELAANETSAAANPAVLLGLPGTWTLIDKAFKNNTITFGTDPSTTGSVAGSGTYINSEIVTYTDHSLLLQLDIQVRSSSTITAGWGVDPVLLATLPIGNYGNYGITKFSPGIVKNVAFVMPEALTASSVICYSIDNSGKLWLNDILNDGTGSGNATRELKGGTHIYINTIIPIPHTNMKDDRCDKFYWKRTA